MHAKTSLYRVVFFLSITLLINCSREFSHKVEIEIPIPDRVVAGEPGEPDRQIGVMVHPDGTREEFVEDEIILAPANEDELTAFLERYNGRILNDGSLPPPPDSLTYERLSRPLQPSGFYVIRIDFDTIDLNDFHLNMAEAGFEGKIRFSSEASTKLIALVAREQLEGKIISNNNLLNASSQCVLDRTQEWPVNPLAPQPAILNEGYYNAFRYRWLNDEKLGVTKAWQYIGLLGLSKKIVPVAFVDFGFHVNKDFRGYPQMWGYDYIEGDYDVAQTGPGKSISFDDHGTSVFSVAGAQLNNRFGSVGTGGQVVVPLFFRVDLESHAANAIYNAAVNWGAEVVNISMNNYDSFKGITGKALNIANSNKVIVVNSAGNDEKDLAKVNHTFTDSPWVIGVGAIDRASKKATRHKTHKYIGISWGSNYGSKVDIWAPGDHFETAALNVTTPQAFAMTSASAPYISGIVAMMKAVKPDLNHTDVLFILQSTANTSPDPRVKPGYVNAFKAVKKTASLAGLSPKGDGFEDNDSFSNAYEIDLNKEYKATINPGDNDYFSFKFSDYVSQSKITLKHKKYGKNNLGGDLMLKLFDDSFKALLTSSNTSDSGYLATTNMTMTGDLDAGKKYHAQVFGTTKESINCYTLKAIQGNSGTLTPDRFDDGKFDDGSSGEPRNDHFKKRAIIKAVVPAISFMSKYQIRDLNFDVVNDTDYFEVTLAPATDEKTAKTECLSSGTKPFGEPGFIQGFLDIAAYPEKRGYAWPFEIRVYDANGKEYTKFTNQSGMSVKFECPHKSFSDGVIRFSVTAKQGRRDFYYLSLHYARWDQFLDAPQWTKLLPYPPLFKFPPFPFEERITWPFPTNPVVIDRYLEGGKDIPLPAEYAILTWEGLQKFKMDIFTEAGNYMEMSLYDAEKQEIARTRVDTNTGKASLEIEDLAPGIYVLAFGPGNFGTSYSLRLDAEE